MKLEVIKSAQGYDNYRIIGEMTEELKNFFVEKGYRWSSYNKCYYPGTIEAKYENANFTEELEKSFFSNNNNDINNKNKEKTVQLEDLIAELREEIRLQKEKIKELESVIEEKNNNVDGIIPKYKSEITNVDTELEEQIDNAIDNKDYEHLANLTTIPENEVQADIVWDIEDETEIIITEEELEICKKIIPQNQYAYTLGLTQGEEGDFYKQKLKDIAKIAKQITTDDELVNNDGTHNVGFHYFVGNSDFYISEIKSDGLAFGYTILNGDIEMAEWGYQDLDEIINASQWIEMDYHVPEGMTIERMLEEKYPEYYKQESVVEIEVDNIIYSEEFIKKFGDWEKAQRLEKLKNSEIIRKPKNVIINGVHFDLQIENARNNKDSKTLRNIAKEIGKSIKGTYINKDLNVEVIISMGNIDEIKNHHILSSGHIEAMQYIPQIIENGIYITEEENQDKQKHPNISKYKYLISGIKIGETDYTCKSVIGVDKDGNHYYDQRLSEIEKGLLLDNLSQLMSRGKSEQSLNNYDKRLMRICQCPQSLYLDENLKPSKETVEKVLNGKLWLEKDSNDIQILHDISNGTEKLIGEELSELLKETKTQDLNLKENIFHSGFNALHTLNEKYAIEFIPAEEGKIEVNSEADKWIVRFFDISKVIPGNLIDKGRFIQSYYASSLLQHQDSNVGLNLGYGWKLDAETFTHAKELIKDFVSIDMSEIFSSKQNNTQQEKTKIENDKEYARELADWIIQYGLENSVSQENYIISYDDIIENTDTTIEWLNKNYELVNEALAEHNDNELLEYDPEESNKNDFNLYFCSNATEKGENTLFKQNKNGRWVRKTDEELELELQEESELENEPVYTINGIEYLESEIEAGLREDIRQIFQEYDASEIEENLVLNNVKLYKGENIDQLSLLVEYDSKNPNNKWTEDALFNALAEENISFAGMKVDINPITPEKSGTIEEYLNNLDSIKTDYENATNELSESTINYIKNAVNEWDKNNWQVINPNTNKLDLLNFYRSNFVALPTAETAEGQLLEKEKFAAINELYKYSKEHNVEQSELVENIIKDYLQEKNSVSQSQNIIEPHTKKEIKNIREQCREILQKSDNEITEEDKLILAQYEGGGGINEENRTSAQVLNEFYTPNNLIEKVWSLVDAYHPNGKTVLEPTAGIGKFANNRPNNQFTMHELDETSARINKILHPEAKLIQGAYQKQFLDENERAKNPDFIQPKYDIVIGNPPYGEYSGKYKNIEGKHHQRYEEYFIEKGLDALKDENSILAYVVPSGFLDSKNDKVKELIASKGQFVDAYRLPAGTFSTTDVGTDILIMRSWEKVRKEFDKDFTNDGHLITKEQAFKSFQRGNAELLSNGEHFKDHPEKILGEIKQRTNQFGKLVDAVVHHEGLSIQDELNKIDDFVSEIKKSNTYENQQESNIESIEELEVVEEESENQKQNFILEKLSAAGIEVVTDKNEFNRILEREELLQKMAIDFSEFEKLEESINNQKSSNLHLQDEKLDLESQKKILQQKNHAKFVEVVKQLEKYIPTNEYMNTTKSVSFYSKVLINSTKLSDRASNNIFLIKVNNPGQNDIFVVRQDPKLYWVEILGKFNDFEKLSQFESVQTLFNDTVIIENFTENLKSYMQQQLVIEQQKQNKLINEVNSSMQKLKEMDIKNSDILSDFVQLDKSLRFNSNFEIESSSLNEMVSIFPGSTGKSGLGIRHIIEERYKKDNLSQDEITALIGLVLDAVRSGKITRESEFQSEFTKNGIVGIVRKNFFGEEKNWILTGFGYDEKSDIDKNREATEAIQTVIAQYSQSQDYSYFRNQVGAVISSLDLNISQTENKSTIQNFITKDGTIYGFAHENKIYLNPDIVSSEAALHEYTHLWDNYTKVTNPELWNKGKDIFKNTYLWEEVKNDPNYQDIAHDEDLILSECHARITGKIADQILDKILTENGELTKNTVIDWDKEVFEYISKEFSENEIDIKSLSEFVSQTMKDFMEGKKLDLSKNLQQEEKVKQNFIFEKLSAAGIEVVIDKDEYQWMKEHIDEINITLNMLDEKPLQIQFNEKKEIEELSTSYNDTQARSQSLNTKIILDSLNSQVFINNLNSLSNIKNKIDSKEFLSSLKKAFYLDDTKSSNYVHNKSNNTELRLSNHCANAISSKKYDKSTSIVIKLVRGKNAPKFRKSPEADLIEFAYYPENLTLEAEKEIINGLIDWIKTGEYTYTQADEVHQSTRKNFVNKNKNQNFITQDGTIYGFTHENKIYLNPDIVSSEAALHEYTHLWDNYTKVTNPELWNKGKEIFKNTYLWEEIKNDPNYQDIANDEDLILSECHARITGKIADQILDKILTENGELTKNTVIDWDKEVFEYISKEFSEIDIKSLSEFVSQTMKDFMEGKKLDLSKNLQQEETPKITKEVIERKIMNVEDFSKLYGKKYDENEIPIWKATNWEGIINLSELNSEEIKYLNSSDNYIQADFGKWTHKILFMSGDIYSKIANYQEKIANKQYKLTSNEIDPGTELLLKQEIELYSKNINLLNSIKKDLVPIENIHLSLKSTMAEEFSIEHFDEEGNIIKLNLQESFILWAKNESYADMKDRKSIDFSTSKISREDLNEKVSWSDIISYIDSESVKAERTSSYFRDSDEVKQLKSQRKKEADEKRQARSDIANKLFDKYIHEGLSEQIKKNLEYEYNQKFNSYVAPDYSKLPLFIDGMSSHKGSSSFKLYEQQIKGISFLCNKGNGLLAYDVGVGKTASGIVATVNQIQSGRSKRPLILVPNQVYSKWYTDIKELFPNVQINDLFNLNEKSVAAFRDSENKNKLNIPENSISLITYEALSRMTFTDDSIKNALFEDFKNLLSIDFDGSEKENASAVEKIKEVIGYSSNVKDSNYFFFEDCGFDNITVDEAHNFKNLWTVPRPKTKGESNEYSGIPSGKPSARALKLYATTQLIQRNNDNRNVFLLTATPFTNSPLEVYSMLTYIGRERLHQAGLNSLRDFLNQFAQTKYELGVNSKGEIDTKQVMKNWRQLPALQSILTEYIDKVDGEEAGIIRPKKFTHVKPLDMTPLQKRMRECDEIRMSSMESSADTIVAMNNMRIAAVAPALANPFMYPDIQLPSINELVETSPKLSFVCNSIIDMYKNNSEKGQFLFLPLGKESHGIIKDYLVKHGIPKEAIEIINGDINNTPEKKEKITSKFNDPKEKLKIIIGGKNTSEGIDLNGNSFVMYNCSLGWNPSETIQAEGRIWRQGNKQGHVHIVYPLMNDSIDSVLYQKHDEKRSRINELWTYKGDSLNVEDINPEELKLELIKDPKKRAKLILDEETKDLKADLSRIDLKIKNYDEIMENKISLGREKERYEESVAEYSKYIEDCKNRNEEVPIWYKSCLDRNKRQLKSANLKLDKINSKLEQLNIFDEESSVTYIRELNEQKKILVDKIESVKEKIPDIIQKLQIELAEQKLLEYPIDKQRKILETDILSNLRPMKEVEVEIKTERYEKMMNLKFHNKEISEEEYKVFVRAGYKLYEEYTKGEIDFKYLQTEVSGELPTIKDLPNNNTISFTWNQGELFFDEEPIINDSSSIAYTNSQNRIDDVHITPEQITESEIKRDEIILPILNGQKSGMYKAFNDFAEHGVFDIIGSQIELENNVISKNGWAQLHAAMNIYRDKKFETFRYIFIEKATGEIKDQVAVAAYMPHRSLINPYENTLKEIISRAEQQDYLVAVAHNHPSGNIKPSDEDVYSTDKLMKSFTSNNGNSRFIGHIILDHNSFSYYDPQTGWQEGSKFEHTQDHLINKNYLLNDLYVDNTLQLHTIATKINDLNNWNDDFIPVIFTNSENMVSGLKLYHKDYFNQSSEKIRNEFQFDGLNVGSIRAFPIITESFAKNNDMEQFEKKLMNHIKNNAFQDASIPKVISITDKFNIPVGKDYFDKINHDEIKINSTWNRFVTPELFSNKQDIKKTETIEW